MAADNIPAEQENTWHLGSNKLNFWVWGSDIVKELNFTWKHFRLTGEPEFQLLSGSSGDSQEPLIAFCFRSLMVNHTAADTPAYFPLFLFSFHYKRKVMPFCESARCLFSRPMSKFTQASLLVQCFSESESSTSKPSHSSNNYT